MMTIKVEIGVFKTFCCNNHWK